MLGQPRTTQRRARKVASDEGALRGDIVRLASATRNRTLIAQARVSEAERVGELQKQVQRLAEAVKDLKPQLGRTEALAEDVKQQVKRLAADYKEIAEVLRGV